MYEDIKIASSVKEQFDLSGRVAVITGGAGFLGMQFASSVAQMGGIPLLLDLKDEYLEKALSKLNGLGYSDCNGYKVDIGKEADCKAVVEQIINKYSKIEVLINNAVLTKESCLKSGKDFFAPFEDADQQLWEDGIRVNLTGTEIMCKIIGPIMASRRKGSIINMASDVGVISPDQRIYRPDEYGYKGVEFNTPVFYAVSKAGVIQLTRYLATYWGLCGVRVNSVSPAGVFRGHDPAFVKKLSACIPLGRMALPNEFKGAIIFLASDASSFVTGTNLMIDGGRTCW
jgi:NAD(P)-dependent dehydrogenase (short-subunit alcohol dehydrogenase family)